VSRRLLSDERGQELVEFAFSSVLFMTLLFLIIDGGIAVWKYNMLANYAQAGARWAAVRGFTSAPTFKAEGTTTGVRDYVQAMDAGLTASVDVAPNTLNPGQTFTVTVSRPMPTTVAFYTWSGTMTAQAQMQIAR
jgi:Flp pilus assembly protein TadG